MQSVVEELTNFVIAASPSACPSSDTPARCTRISLSLSFYLEAVAGKLLKRIAF